MTKKYQICTRCVMDTSDPDIEFDENGFCNHCNEHLRYIASIIDDPKREEKLNQDVAAIKLEGKNKEYDCVIGVSGGTDSTYVAYLVNKLGLRPLAVHIDNGWNSELAVKNIEHILNKLNIDLYTVVIDWEEFRDLQISLLKASVPDCELPSDHTIRAVLWSVAIKYGIKTIVNGRNFHGEGILPWGWSYSALDWHYIKNIHKKFGKKKLKHFPHFGFARIAYTVLIKKIKLYSILNYVTYEKKDVVKVLKDELGWTDYGGKHYESVYTKFYQGYILPTKFGYDKRRAHTSSLICSGQISRDEGLAHLLEPPYPINMIEDDKAYIIKKLGLTKEEFTRIMDSEVRSYVDYKNRSYFLILDKNPLLKKALKWAKKTRILGKGFANYAAE